MVEYKRREIGKMREKNQEWYRFLRGGNVAQDNGVDRLRINGKYVNDEQQIVNEIKRFGEEIGGMNGECIELNGNMSLSKHESE